MYDGRALVWRVRGTRYEERNMQQYDRWGGGSVMVWGAISFGNKSVLHHIDGTLNAQLYIDDILDPIAIPFGRATVGPGFLFQDDNARPHATRIVQEYHERHFDYTHMQWPPYSPDLNPIEQACDMLGRKLSEVDPKPTTLDELLLELQIQWATISRTKIRKLIRSMRKRIRECITARGGPTHY